MECFRSEAERRLYLGLVEEQGRRFECAVHAYVLMPNHVHLLITPADPRAVPRFMKDIGQRYAQSFNRVHSRTGPLFDGRFRSSIVDSERYLFTCYRYIEFNPVRAGLVRHPWEYAWSSFGTNAAGIPSTFVTPHPLYRALGSSDPKRQSAYWHICQEALSDHELASVRAAINANAVLGSREFAEEVARRSGRRAAAAPPGRPARGVPPGGKRGTSPV